MNKKPITVCPHCKGLGKRVQFSRSRWGDESDPLARRVHCEPCRGSGELCNYDALVYGEPAPAALVEVA